MTRYYFTFMQKQTLLKKKYVVLTGTTLGTRKEMWKNFGSKWAHQYSEDEWLEDGVFTQAAKYNLTELK